MLKSILQNFPSRKPAPAPGLPSGAESEFFDHLMARFFSGLDELQENNFDYERFNIAPGTPVGGDARRSFLWYQMMREHLAPMTQVRNLFKDKVSRDLYDDLLLYRLSGHAHMRLPTNNERHWAMREAARGYQTGDSGISGFPRPLGRFGIEFDGESIDLQCWEGNVAWTFLIKQYYFGREGVVIQVEPGDIVIDAGACFGDTALAFAASAGPDGRVLAFDIMPGHLEVIRANLASNPRLGGRIEAVEAALSESNVEMLYIHGEGPGAYVSGNPSPQAVTVTTIDEMAARRLLPRIDFIKMDIEGAEGAALRGATRSIKRWRPKLAISLYHRPADIWELPLLIDSMGVDYDYYLDHYTIHTEETVLYAVPRPPA
ncbi:MAG TPA: FkbM family methyltransferase [Burkholderiales bacterium]|jgi:FkbM family methyltransferase|nr:FkbM family methyltransferase [Burkholderiales bacterium]